MSSQIAPNQTDPSVNTTPEDKLGQTNDECQGDTASPTEIPKGIPPRLWQKFQVLKDRREKACKKSTEKRVSRLKAEVLNKVQQEITEEEDLNIMKAHGVYLPENPKSNLGGIKMTDNRNQVEGSNKEPNDGVKESSISVGSGGDKNEEEWLGIKQYIGINERFKQVGKGQHGPKGNLEQKIDVAIEEGDFETAEKLSDRIALQKFGTQVNEAINAKKFVEKRKKEEDSVKANKKVKLSWGFDHKQKWETKSNM